MNGLDFTIRAILLSSRNSAEHGLLASPGADRRAYRNASATGGAFARLPGYQRAHGPATIISHFVNAQNNTFV
jgi:hypothetical protein